MRRRSQKKKISRGMPARVVLSRQVLKSTYRVWERELTDSLGLTTGGVWDMDLGPVEMTPRLAAEVTVEEHKQAGRAGGGQRSGETEVLGMHASVQAGGPCEGGCRDTPSRRELGGDDRRDAEASGDGTTMEPMKWLGRSASLSSGHSGGNRSRSRDRSRSRSRSRSADDAGGTRGGGGGRRHSRA